MLIHIVKKGDTLYRIAARYGVSVQRLQSDNGITANQTLVVGQALIVTLPAVTYTVQPGDNLSTIASAYGVTVMELIQNNPSLALSDPIYPGQVLTIRFQGSKIRTLTTHGYAYSRIDRTTLRRALPYMTYLAVFSYGFTESGDLIPVDDSELIRYAYQFEAPPVLVLTTIDENGGFSTAKAKRLLNDVALQNKVLDNVIAVMQQKATQVGLPILNTYPADGQAYLGFFGNAAAKLHANGYFSQYALAPKTSAGQAGLLYEAHDYAALGAISDTVQIMTYEWGFTFSPPMAVAPLDKVRAVIEYAVSVIPNEKIYMGIPNYGYIWTLPYVRGESRAEAIGNEYAVRLAARYGAEIQYDETLSLHFLNIIPAAKNMSFGSRMCAASGQSWRLPTNMDCWVWGTGASCGRFPELGYISARYNVTKVI